MSSSPLSALQPAALWSGFSDLNAIPRASKKEQQVIAFMESFARSLGLPVTVDEVGNVIVKKPATPGMENRKTVILQSHLDMVHQKNADTDFDFDTMGIQMLVDEDWVKARGTTLGADNGIGVAAIMALLASKDIPHPPLEALFTIDEETGMTGALGLKGGLLEGRILLNLDTEDDTELTIGCAGGLDVTAKGSYRTEKFDGAAYLLKVQGLTGGHSGMDIHLNRGNANKLLTGLLRDASALFGAAISHFDGGGLRNAIPREAMAGIAVPEDRDEDFLMWLAGEIIALRKAFAETDPQLSITCVAVEDASPVMTESDQRKWLNALQQCHNGVYRMSEEISGLVQTSNNMARVLIRDGSVSVLCLTRSADEADKAELGDKIRKVFESCGASVEFSGAYPGWKPAPDSGIVKLLRSLYEQRFGSAPHVNACHAGLECGILSTNYPGMEMVSFGPNIRGAHSPDEKVQISSVQKFWGFLLQILESIPEK